jgi:hypothetical protein
MSVIVMVLICIVLRRWSWLTLCLPGGLGKSTAAISDRAAGRLDHSPRRRPGHAFDWTTISTPRH